MSQGRAHHQSISVSSDNHFNIERIGINSTDHILILTRVLESARKLITTLSIVLHTATVHTSYEAVLLCLCANINSRGVHVTTGTFATPALIIRTVHQPL